MWKHKMIRLASVAVFAAACGLFAEETPLPTGFVQLAWIESTGQQYIDTGVNAGANTTVDIAFGHCPYISEGVIFGKDIWNPKGWLFLTQNDHFRFFGANGSEPGAAWNLIDKDTTGLCDYRFTLGTDNTARMFTLQGKQLCELPTDRTATSNHSLWIFDRHHHYGKPGAFRFYSMKLGQDDGTELRDFVPARRTSDGAAGLYDRVTNAFFENLGTAPFITPDDPVSAVWTGGGDGVSLTDAANWECYGADEQVMAGAVPAQKTTIKIVSEASAAVPLGNSNPFGKVALGRFDHPLTQWGRISYGSVRYNSSDMPNYNFVGIGLNDYTWRGGSSAILAELDDYNTAWMNSNLLRSQLRFDGWVNVDESKAGTWEILQCFDDYFHFTLDGRELAKSLTFRYATSFTNEVSAGWHRFTVICGDCWGGCGSLRWSGSNWTGPGYSYGPMTITVGGNSFKLSDLPQGAGDNQTLTLTADRDWRALGMIDMGNARKIDLAGHKLYLAGFTNGDLSLQYLGSEITDSVGGGELHLDSAASWANTTVRISGGLKVFKEGAGTFTSSVAKQPYSGGTEVVAGTFKSGAEESFGNKMGTVTIRLGATLDLDGWGNSAGRKYVLDGGTIKSATMRSYRDNPWLSDVTLTADSFMSGRDFGFHQGSDTVTLDLAGHTLTISSTTSGREFFFCNLVATGGGRIVMNGAGYLGYYNSRLATDITYVQGVRLVSYDHNNDNWNTVFGDYDASGYAINDACEARSQLQVAGRFKPGVNFHNCQLLAGATLDLSAFTEPWNCQGVTEGVTCDFADNAVINVDVGNRAIHNEDYLLYWPVVDDEPQPPPDGTRFVLAPSSTSGHRYLIRTATGLMVQSGIVIFVR